MGWMTILSSVPWGEVITRAPAVADGAKKLWQRVGKGKATVPAAAGEMDSLGQLQGRIADLEAEMLASSELIRALAEQNAQLVARLDGMRRLAWVLGLGVIAGLALAGFALLR